MSAFKPGDRVAFQWCGQPTWGHIVGRGAFHGWTVLFPNGMQATVLDMREEELTSLEGDAGPSGPSKGEDPR